MNFSIDAIYEDGVLKPISPLPLQEHSRVRVSLEMVPEQSRATAEEALLAIRRTARLLGPTGDGQLLRQIAEDDEFGILESP